ncbi:hypothetical protein AbraIFM66950_007209 [Aspergillus brasiliensis]|nr:hypothetical protein AbraIFM66950_007209 [Aspergillus brasiliensis]
MQRLKNEKDSNQKLIDEVADLRDEINTLLRSTPQTGSIPDALSRLKNLRIDTGCGASASPSDNDLISEGAVSLDEAEDMFNMFTACVNPLLFDGLLMQHQTLDSVRRSSAMLTAAILTVAALLSPDRAEVCGKCHETFVSLSLRRRLATTHHNSLDGVRALCIGAFYFESLGERLSSEAIHVSRNLGLDEAFHRYMQGGVADMERVRLWCIAYICEQCFTTNRGCPLKDVAYKPVWDMTRIPHQKDASHEDRRLIALLLYFDTLATAHAAFYNDPRQPLKADDTTTLLAFDDAVKRCLQEYPAGTLYSNHPFSSFPKDIKGLMYAFAQFQIYSLAFRGIFPYHNGPTNFQAWSHEHCFTAGAAVDAALRILHMIGTNSDLSLNLRYVPIYIHHMVGYCATFTLRIAGLNIGLAGSNKGDLDRLGLAIDPAHIAYVVLRVAQCLCTKGAELNQEHTSSLVASSLLTMLRLLSDVQRVGNSEVPKEKWDLYLDHPMVDPPELSVIWHADGTFGIGFNHLLPFWLKSQAKE